MSKHLLFTYFKVIFKVEVFMKSILSLIFYLIVCIAHGQYPQWKSIPNTLNGDIHCAVVYNNQLVIGGKFTQAGSSNVRGLASWDGVNWSSFGDGLGCDMIGNPEVSIDKMIVHDGNLFVAGRFNTQQDCIGNNIAMWDGVEWTDLNGGANSRVYDMEIYNNELYISGVFDQVGGEVIHEVAKWTGTSWVGFDSMFGFPVTSSISSVQDFQNFDGKLFMAGSIVDSIGDFCGTIVEFDGSTWTCHFELDSINAINYGQIKHLTVWNETLLAGTSVSSIGGQSIKTVYEFENGFWDVFSAQNTTLRPEKIVTYQNDIYMVGAGGLLFTDSILPRVSKWDGSSWNMIGTGITSLVKDAIVYNDELYIFGGFCEERGSRLQYMAKLQTHPIGIVEEISRKPFKIYPNPIYDILNIQFNKNVNEGHIVLTNVVGKRLHKEVMIASSLQNYSIDVSHYVPGVYFIQVINDETLVHEQKVIIK